MALLEEHHKYWDAFYKDVRSSAVPSDPTAFAVWVAERLEPQRLIVEFGFGTARDSLWFARNGHPVRGFDFAESAVEHAQASAADLGNRAGFAALDLADDVAVKAVVEQLDMLPGRPAVYGRFLIHSLEERGRHNLMSVARDLGGELYVEFRTGQDREGQHLFGDDHYRTYLDAEVVAAEIADLGGTVTVLEQGHGLAVYKSEDPHVARIVASFDR